MRGCGSCTIPCCSSTKRSHDDARRDQENRRIHRRPSGESGSFSLRTGQDAVRQPARRLRPPMVSAQPACSRNWGTRWNDIPYRKRSAGPTAWPTPTVQMSGCASPICQKPPRWWPGHSASSWPQIVDCNRSPDGAHRNPGATVAWMKQRGIQGRRGLLFRSLKSSEKERYQQGVDQIYEEGAHQRDDDEG